MQFTSGLHIVALHQIKITVEDDDWKIGGHSVRNKCGVWRSWCFTFMLLVQGKQENSAENFAKPSI